MQRGTIISLKPVHVLPTFTYACTHNPSFLGIYAKHLAKRGFALPHAISAGGYRRYIGDNAVLGKGELLVWQPR
jgi:hypothetical protein